MKRYTVTGTDENGDIQAFGSDDRTRADAVLAQMSEDLEDVALVDIEAEGKGKLKLRYWDKADNGL